MLSANEEYAPYGRPHRPVAEYWVVVTKQEQFLCAVQTTLLANSINLTTQPEFIDGNRHIISASGMSNSVRAALAASERLPETLSAFEAAMEFCG